MGNFETEKLAIEYCAAHGIDLYDPIRGQVITAFCIATKLEREACAKAAEDFNTFPHALSTIGERISDVIRMRSNAEVWGGAPTGAASRTTAGLEGDNNGEKHGN